MQTPTRPRSSSEPEIQHPPTLGGARANTHPSSLWKSPGLARCCQRALTLLIGSTVVCVMAQVAPPGIPKQMTYQGYVVDGSGKPIGQTAPTNHVALFKVYSHPTASGAEQFLWGEVQTVTFADGHFSVVLGQGAGIDGAKYANLEKVFEGTDTSSRYIGIAIKTGTEDPKEIAPRLQLVTAPFAFLARSANQLLSEVDGSVVITASGGNVTINGTLSATSIEGGTLVNVPSSKIIGPALDTSLIPDIDATKITTGQLDQNRIPPLNTSKITSGQFFEAQIPDLRPHKIVAIAPHQKLAVNLIPPLPASIITSGKLSQDLMPNNLALSSSSYGKIFEIQSDGDLRLYNLIDKSRWVDLWRTSSTESGRGGFRIDLGGRTTGSGGGDNSAIYDGDSDWNFTSDLRLKKDIADVEPMLDRAMSLTVRRYRWKGESESETHKLGVIAQEVRPIFPDLVTEISGSYTNESILTVGYTSFGLVAIKAMQEFKAQHDADLEALKVRMDEILFRMDALARENEVLRYRLNQR